ncbi:MAG TPA: DNA starvation/stationary phase protection protein [Bacillota bacterium]|nr:DNA starvation/stationary phase protection protein [Bacillota bacterium]
MKNKRLVHFLNQTLSNYFVMFVKLHRYHWYVKGKNFFTLHEKFEDMYNMFGEDVDELAERIMAIGGKPYATMEKFLESTSLKEASADDEEIEMITQLRSDYEQITQEIKETGIPLAEEENDEPTLDLLVGYQEELEKYIWMLNAYLANE